MLLHRIGTGVLVAAASLTLASAALAGGGTMRLNGVFPFEDQSQGDANEACVVLNGEEAQVAGAVLGATDTCQVLIQYVTSDFNKASGSLLKDDNGTAKVSQQVGVGVGVLIGGEGCETLLSTEATVEDCKASGSVKAEEPSEAVEKGKANLTCDLGESLQALGELSQGQVDAIVDAFSDRSDVKLTSSGKLTIKTKGVPNTAGHVCAS